MADLTKRQYYPDDDYDYGWWYSETAVIVKWSIIAAVVLIVFAYIGGGYFHARRRMSKGLPPLAYHRWMVRRQLQPQAYNLYTTNQYGYQTGPQQYGYYASADGYAPPPPVYNPNHAPPPNYYPDGMSDIPLQNKNTVNPDQRVGESSGNVGGIHSGEGSAPRY